MMDKIDSHGRSGGGSSDRTFGLVFAIFSVVLALLPLLHGGDLRIWAVVVAISFFTLAIVVPRVLAPLNRLWTRVGLVLHGIVSPIALGVLFFGMITPMAIIMRMAGKDPLLRKFDRGSASYWIRRDQSITAPDSMNNQF